MPIFKVKVYKSTFTNMWYGVTPREPAEKPKTAMTLVCLLPEEKVLGGEARVAGSFLLHCFRDADATTRPNPETGSEVQT